jgi:hypothetical protein
VSLTVRSAFVAAVAALVVGCGGDKVAMPEKQECVAVTGFVKYRGKPVANAEVVFHSADGKVSPRGRTDAAGLYALSTYIEKDGAPPGLYKVTITHNPAATGAKLDDGGMAPLPPDGEGFKGGPAVPKSEIPVKYSNPATTTESADVKAGAANTHSFDLK